MAIYLHTHKGSDRERLGVFYEYFQHFTKDMFNKASEGQLRDLSSFLGEGKHPMIPIEERMKIPREEDYAEQLVSAVKQEREEWERKRRGGEMSGNLTVVKGAF